VLSLYTLAFSGAGPLGTLLYAGLSRVIPLFQAIGVGALIVGAILLWSSTRLGSAQPAERIPQTVGR
jgi:hypothetical protein